MPRLSDSRIVGYGGGYGGGGGGGASDGGGGGLGGGFGTLGQMMQIKEQQDLYRQRQMKRQQEQEDFDDDVAIRETLPKYDRPDEAIDDLYKQGRAKAASKLGKSIYEERKAKAAAYDAQLVSAGKRLTHAGQIAQGISDDATYRPARQALVDLLSPIYGDGINDILPTTYDAKQMKALIAAGTDRANQITAEHNAAMEVQTALNNTVDRAEKFTKIAANLVSQSKTKAQADGYFQNLYAMGAPKQSLEAFAFDDADPEGSRKRATQLGLSGKEEADLANAAADDVRADARNKVLEKQGDRRNAIADWRAQQAAGGGTGTGAPRRGSTLPMSNVSDLKKARNNTIADALKRREADIISDDQLIDARLRAWNDYRDAAEFRPSFQKEAAAAVKAGDKKAYDKVVEEYEEATEGKRKLSSIVPWKDATTGSGPTGGRGGGAGSETKREEMDRLAKEFTTAAPMRQRVIQVRLDYLRNH